ncbi:MAG TPA: 3-deoxy-D-manno-octulosonic acid transferase [Ideonella sp.]|nr:3-deoxy-D-manno-octulosonic acid transferase [Ideonella sp.]
MAARVGWRERLARGGYSALLALLPPAYLLRLWRRSRAEPLYRHALGERFGRYGAHAPALRGAVWIHAVSLGETRAAAALVAALRELRPDLRLLLTHGTATGREAGAALLDSTPRPDGLPRDVQVWLPFDTVGATRRFIARFHPAVGVLMETELWPNLLHAAARAGVPMVLANARLSARSERRGRRLDAVLRPAVASLALVLAQTEDDARRLAERGAREVEVCGNLKFDMAPDAALQERGRSWGHALGRPVVLAASTRDGEEAPLLAAWRAESRSPRPLLLIVPRHPQRFDAVAALVEQAGFTVARRSAFGEIGPGSVARAADVWIGDSMGEMPLYYAAADVALLGGSFGRFGGQNLIEAAACGCPVVMGPHTWNFAEAAELALRAGAATRVTDLAEGVRRALALTQPDLRAPLLQGAQRFAACHRGAARRMAERIVALL